ncbi:MAG TPA: type II toxin-antitoxin system prevent-host-death family antitoxin [Anaerolineae bacterium]|jgi:prevent-host-death family protein|nr:type II toxin-antitoxin system prevent-host-death family antitoxin [Anaerolineae bacterium]
MLKHYSITEARDHFSALIREGERGEAVELTRRGERVAVIMWIQKYQELQVGKRGFWRAYEDFRDKYDLEPLDAPSVFEGLRGEA